MFDQPDDDEFADEHGVVLPKKLCAGALISDAGTSGGRTGSEDRKAHECGCNQSSHGATFSDRL
jgi:hypothetical protein